MEGGGGGEAIPVPHSPTSIVDEEEDEGGDRLEMVCDAGEEDQAQVDEGVGKRKRPEGFHRRRDESPTKRVAESEEGAVTSRELRLLLGQHMKEMRESWGNIEARIAVLEGEVKGHKKELHAIHTKIKADDQRTQQIQAKGDATSRRTDELEGKVQQLEQKLDDINKEREEQKRHQQPNLVLGGHDPWGEYLAKQGGKQGGGEQRGDASKQASLSEEDQRSLIVGGWLPDTKRLTIEDEARAIFENNSFENLLDGTKLVIFGPRRSFGILRFKIRENEDMAGVKARMWQVIQKVRADKHVLPSTQGENEGKNMWASFLKTPEARKRSAMCSLTRRVVMQLASCNRNADGEVVNQNAMAPECFDIDWGTGTIWNGVLKIASATHRRDINRQDDYISLAQGWVDLRAVTTLTGASWTEASEAFAREQ